MDLVKYLRTIFYRTPPVVAYVLNMFLLGLSYLIFLVFVVADFEHVFFCCERYRITIAVPRILKVSYPANKHSKSTTETMKQDVKSVKS